MYKIYLVYLALEYEVYIPVKKIYDFKLYEKIIKS